MIFENTNIKQKNSDLERIEKQKHIFDGIKDYFCPLSQTLLEGQSEIYGMGLLECLEYNTIEQLEEYIESSLTSYKWQQYWIRAIGKERYREIVEDILEIVDKINWLEKEGGGNL